MRILYIEDSEDDAFLFERALNKVIPDAVLQVSTTAHHGLSLLRSGTDPFDVIVLDYILPDQNGAEVLRAIRSTEEWAQLPVVLFSGAVIPDHHIPLLKLPKTCHILKPVHPEGYKMALERILYFCNHLVEELKSK